MSAPMLPLVVRDYDGLVKALVARRHALGWSQLELDERVGFPTGYSGKLEAYLGRGGRIAGSLALPLWLQALGVGLMVVEIAPATGADRLGEMIDPQRGANRPGREADAVDVGDRVELRRRANGSARH